MTEEVKGGEMRNKGREKEKRIEESVEQDKLGSKFLCSLELNQTPSVHSSVFPRYFWRRRGREGKCSAGWRDAASPSTILGNVAEGER